MNVLAVGEVQAPAGYQADDVVETGREDQAAFGRKCGCCVG